MRIEDLMLFQDVVKYHSMNIASEKHFMTPQNLSKIIRNLEDEFQVTLFRRSKKGSELTEIGEAFYLQVLKVLEEYEGLKRLTTACSAAKNESAPDEQPLKILCNKGIISDAVFEAYAARQKQTHNFLVDINCVDEYGAQELAALANEAPYDVVACSMLEKDEERFITLCSSYVPLHVIYDEMVLIVSKKHPLATRSVIAKSELREVELLVYNEDFIDKSIVKKDARWRSSFNLSANANMLIEESDELGALYSKSFLKINKQARERGLLTGVPLKEKDYVAFVVMIRHEASMVVRQFAKEIASSFFSDEGY